MPLGLPSSMQFSSRSRSTRNVSCSARGRRWRSAAHSSAVGSVRSRKSSRRCGSCRGECLGEPLIVEPWALRPHQLPRHRQRAREVAIDRERLHHLGSERGSERAQHPGADRVGAVGRRQQGHQHARRQRIVAGAVQPGGDQQVDRAAGPVAAPPRLMFWNVERLGEVHPLVLVHLGEACPHRQQLVREAGERGFGDLGRGAVERADGAPRQQQPQGSAIGRLQQPAFERVGSAERRDLLDLLERLQPQARRRDAAPARTCRQRLGDQFRRELERRQQRWRQFHALESGWRLLPTEHPRRGIRRQPHVGVAVAAQRDDLRQQVAHAVGGGGLDREQAAATFLQHLAHDVVGGRRTDAHQGAQTAGPAERERRLVEQPQRRRLRLGGVRRPGRRGQPFGEAPTQLAAERARRLRLRRLARRRSAGAAVGVELQQQFVQHGAGVRAHRAIVAAELAQQRLEVGLLPAGIGRVEQRPGRRCCCGISLRPGEGAAREQEQDAGAGRGVHGERQRWRTLRRRGGFTAGAPDQDCRCSSWRASATCSRCRRCCSTPAAACASRSRVSSPCARGAGRQRSAGR